MHRFTVSIEEELAEKFDALIEQKGYQSRSEAFRDLLRTALEENSFESGSVLDCVANVSYVYNHHERELASRLTSIQHEHHDLTIATMHAHLDHDHCLESVMLRGKVSTVNQFAQSIIAQTGVRHGHINLISSAIAFDTENTHVSHTHKTDVKI